MSGTLASVRARFASTLVRGAVGYALLSMVIVLMVGWGNADFIGMAFAVLFASATVGIIVGFIFGVPRVAARDLHDNITQATSAERLVLNSNLARVSDWLTTIIIGLGLVQFGKVLDGMGWLGGQFAKIFGNSGALSPDAAPAFGLCLVLSSFGIAFVIMFLWTSTRLIDVLRTSNEGHVNRE